MPWCQPTAHCPCRPRRWMRSLLVRWCGCTRSTVSGRWFRRAGVRRVSDRQRWAAESGALPDGRAFEGDGELADVESPPLRVEGVTVRYGSTVAVAGADLEAYAGEFVAITGHSGAGKSSLLWAIGGAVASEGTVRLGDDLVRDRAQAARLGIE